MKRIQRHALTFLIGLAFGLVGGILLARPPAPPKREPGFTRNPGSDWLAQVERTLEEDT